MRFSLLLAGLLAVGLPALGTPTLAAPRVVATIAPVQGLVSMVTEGITTPQLLIPASSSPHGLALKPSDRQMLNDAELIVWVGPGLEDGLAKLLNRAPNALLLSAVPGLHWQKPVPDDHDHSKEAAAKSQASRPPAPKSGEMIAITSETSAKIGQGLDPHLWLDARNAKLWIKAIAARLSKMDPANAAAYAANAAKADLVLTVVDSELQASLAPVKGRRFIATHDAYRYFAARYGAISAGSLAGNHGDAKGASTMQSLRKLVLEQGVTCILSEPQFDDRKIMALSAGTNAKVVVADPLGGALTLGSTHYPTLMRSLARNMLDCLK